MDSNWRSKLKNTLCGLETSLKDVDSEHDREIEAVHLKHKSRREALQQAINSVTIALEDGKESETIPEPVREGADSVLSGIKSDEAEHLNGTGTAQNSSQNQNGTDTRKFSARREIEKLLPELDPEKDITQGEVRYELEERFPKHKDSLKAASISSALRRLVDAGKLILVSKGSGAEPNIYRLTEHINSGNGQEELGEVRE